MTDLQIARRTLFTRTASGLGAFFGAGFGLGLAPAAAQTAAFQSPMASEIRKDEFSVFRKLPNGDRQYAILPNTAHSQRFSKNRQPLWYVAKNFLDAPTPVAS